MSRKSFSPPHFTNNVIDLAPITKTGSGFQSRVPPPQNHATAKSTRILQKNNSSHPVQGAFGLSKQASHSRSSSTGISAALTSGSGNLFFPASTSQIYSQYHHIFSSPQSMLPAEKSASALFLTKLLNSSSPQSMIRKPLSLASTPKQKDKKGKTAVADSAVYKTQRKGVFEDKGGAGESLLSGDRRGLSCENYEKGQNSGLFERKGSIDEKNKLAKTASANMTSLFGKNIKAGKRKIRSLGNFSGCLKSDSYLEEKSGGEADYSLNACNQLRALEKNNIRKNVEEMDKLLDRYHERVAAIMMLSQANLSLRKQSIMKEKIKEAEKQREIEKQVLELRERMNVQVPEKFEKYKSLLSPFINNHLCDYETLNKNYRKENEKYLTQNNQRTALHKNPMMVFNIATCRRKYMSAKTPIRKFMAMEKHET